jgi:integrase
VAKLGRGVRVAPSKATLAEFAERWLEGQTELRPRTRTAYRSNLRLHVLPRLGRRRLAEISEDDLARLIADLRAQGLSGWTIRSILTPLGRVLGHAARRGLIPANPMRKLERGERPAVGRREMRILDREQIGQLLEAARTPTYRALLATAIFTGLRQGELLGLTWADVDFSGGLVRVRKSLDRPGTRTEPKTPHAIREVALMPALGRILREHKLRSSFSGPGDFVFASRTSSPLNWRNVSRRGLGSALKRAEIEHVRWHDLRHTYASLLIAEGLNVVYVSRQLGHASADITLRVYAHLFDRAEHAQRASAALEAGFGSILETHATHPSEGMGSRSRGSR